MSERADRLGTNLLFNHDPLLTNNSRQSRPYLSTHTQISFGQSFELQPVPVISSSVFHQAFVSFATSVWRLRWEVCPLDGSPVHTLGASCHECGVILRIPCPRRRSYRCHGLQIWKVILWVRNWCYGKLLNWNFCHRRIKVVIVLLLREIRRGLSC